MNNFAPLKSRRPGRTLPLTLLALVANSAMLVSPAHAQMNEGYWTFGIGAGQTRGNFDEGSLTARNSSVVLPNAITSQSISTDRNDVGGKVFLGRQFNRFIGMELGYFDLGKFGWQTTTTPAGSLTGEIRAQGVNVDLLGTLPLSTNLSALGRVGATYTRTRSQYTSTGILATLDPSPSERKTQPKFGLGLQYAFHQGFQMRLEGEEYRVNDALGSRGKVRMYAASLVFPFGRTEQPAPRAAYVAPQPAPAPAPQAAPMVMVAPPPVVVAQAPAPAPAPVIVPLRRVKYEAESLFAFDASAVRPEGKLALDSFAADLAGTQYDSITVEGHTDRLGSTAYNQKLSMQRAEAVKDYLVQIRGLSSSKVSAIGKGEDEPITVVADCKGTAQTVKLVACLQPDRRVEIEVSGTR